MGQRRNKKLARRNPFAGYPPGEQDVFVAAYVKSGTNWTMQIAHQLLNHGKGEFAHIHEVIPWPDQPTGPLRNFAVPLEDESVWRASPEGKRVIKTHLNWDLVPYSEAARYIADVGEALQAAAPYELGSPVSGGAFSPALYPVYVRGEACLAARQDREAAVEFQKILDYRGVVLNEPIGALAHLGLARAYVLQGDTPKAKAAYQDFLTLWKDADPDIPILLAAKAEYAKLH